MKLTFQSRTICTRVEALAFDQQSALLAVGGGRDVALFKLVDRQFVALSTVDTLFGVADGDIESSEVRAIAFSRNAQTIAVSTEERANGKLFEGLRLFDVTTGEHLYDFLPLAGQQHVRRSKLIDFELSAGNLHNTDPRLSALSDFANGIQIASQDGTATAWTLHHPGARSTVFVRRSESIARRDFGDDTATPAGFTQDARILIGTRSAAAGPNAWVWDIESEQFYELPTPYERDRTIPQHSLHLVWIDPLGRTVLWSNSLGYLVEQSLRDGACVVRRPELQIANEMVLNCRHVAAVSPDARWFVAAWSSEATDSASVEIVSLESTVSSLFTLEGVRDARG